MSFSCSITKAANTHSEYVIRIAFPQEQLLSNAPQWYLIRTPSVLSIQTFKNKYWLEYGGRIDTSRLWITWCLLVREGLFCEIWGSYSSTADKATLLGCEAGTFRRIVFTSCSGFGLLDFEEEGHMIYRNAVKYSPKYTALYSRILQSSHYSHITSLFQIV
jgi:hypothetical protein